ncbi:organic solute transporter alpha-like protein [Drosophila nasuta]|uniref:organic solute transporter alpha-like protein n=1 Tax=Drosophila nasuta TaxID=42062 RepID=UPI00295EE42D|nr:organic solute transporter alpha-like protein [Drosophila nasuta]XP_060657874.1 organic solute transporter alpha-like protein [Drosophila nasuta]XP_060657876.1 organic solute transporter alpha-like protein [Drosophila nasuta]XP_060657877.1 organic solute transporter alpha-like protein [Drosophila nasuta]
MDSREDFERLRELEQQEQVELELELQRNRTMRMHSFPKLSEYYTHMTAFLSLAIFIAVLLTILNISIYLTTAMRMRRHLDKPLRIPSILMVSVYPIISLAALVTILVPYSWFICHTVMHAMFMAGGPVFRTLLFRYVVSEQNYLKETSAEAVSLNTPPCCCCCGCLPTVVPTKAKLCISRYMVWQMPFWQGSIMLVMNILYYRDRQLYLDVMIFFIPFIVGSIIMGAWSLQITVRMITKIRGDYQLRKKMFCLQLVVMLCKLQYLILYEQLNSVKMGGEYPINHTIYKQTIINILILVEMVLVSMMAQSAYRTPIQVQVDQSNVHSS